MMFVKNNQQIKGAILVVLCMISVSMATSTAIGQEFRITTNVFLEQDEKPISTNLTLFSDAVIYDFAEASSGEVTVFDLNRGRIVLLNPTKQIKTTLTTEFLLMYVKQLRQNASEETNNKLFTADLSEEAEVGTKRFAVSSDNLTYTVDGAAAKFPSAVKRYQYFADWFARLNATRVGNLPPQARIRINQVVADHKMIPETVTRVLKAGIRRQVVRATHHTNWLWTNTDRKRIADVSNQLAQFKEVEHDAYFSR